jgi:phosphoglucosamine mutase
MGRDTRESGEWITQALTGSLMANGIPEVYNAGVITTPGLAFLTRRDQFQLGIMISASHNPFRDNGIKIFSSDGYKLPDALELEIEKRIDRALKASRRPDSAAQSKAIDGQKLVEEYVAFLTSECSKKLTGFTIGMDLANGAAYQIAPEVFRRLGANLKVIHGQPDGLNINLNCGSLHLESLIDLVCQSKLSFGIAFDGDADRSLFVTASGKIFDGDYVLYALSECWKTTGELTSDKIVGTLMTNLALEKILEKKELQLIRAAVGDKYVLEEMIRHGANLGGEPSGHVILRNYHTTGDGILTAVKLAELLSDTNTDLDTLAAGYHPFPQILDGLKVRQRVSLTQTPEIAQLIAAAETTLGESGRLVIRYSGTEPLLRIMAEGQDADLVISLVAKLKSDLKTILG